MRVRLRTEIEIVVGDATDENLQVVIAEETREVQLVREIPNVVSSQKKIASEASTAIVGSLSVRDMLPDLHLEICLLDVRQAVVERAAEIVNEREMVVDVMAASETAPAIPTRLDGMTNAAPNEVQSEALTEGVDELVI